MSAQTLDGTTVVVTRSREQNASLAKALSERGAEVVNVATIRFEHVHDHEAARRLKAERESYTHLVFTSQVAVRFFCALSENIGIPVDDWHPHSVAAVGAATAEALQAAGLRPTHTGKDGGASSLARKLLDACSVTPESRLLVPQSAIARPELVEELTAAGIDVTPLVVYETIAESADAAGDFLARVRSGPAPNAILFARPSAVTSFIAMTGEAGERFLRSVPTIVSIGPTTTKSLTEHGFTVHGEADSPGASGLVRALESAIGP